MTAIEICGQSLTLAQAEEIAAGAPIRIGDHVRERVEQSREVVRHLAQGSVPIYAVNTGFGYLAREKVSPADQTQCQHNMLRSHAAGHGPPLDTGETRLAMALRLNVLAKGMTGVRYEVLEKLLELIEKEVYPLIPSCGSVGASGDLVPLAHLALPLAGEGMVTYQGQRLEAKEALKLAGITPLSLVTKEGLSLINGTQVMLAIGGLAVGEAFRLVTIANKICALSLEGLLGHRSILDPRLHSARGHIGQRECAEAISRELIGSTFLDAKEAAHVQDAYSLRCAPQVHGAVLDALDYAKKVVETEFGAATDNPLVIDEETLSGGNFHGAPLALAYDFACIALTDLASISERRLNLLVDSNYSKLPSFLTKQPGLHSGYMSLQYLAGSLVNEAKVLAHPASTDSIPANVGIEDHVSMGATASKKLKAVAKKVKVVLSCELLAATQAIDLRKGYQLGKGTQRSYNLLRSVVPTLDKDRFLSGDIDAAVSLINDLLEEA